MTFSTLIFYLISIMLIYAAIRTVSSKNPVHAALYLVLAFFSGAAHWVLIQAEFLGITLVLVYVGAVMVLFVFVVMMLDINFELMHKDIKKNLPVALVVSVSVLIEIVLVLISPDAEIEVARHFTPAINAEGVSNVKQLGLDLYTVYLLPFEVAAVILVLAIVAAIALTIRKRKDTKFVDPSEQVSISRDGRVRLVDIVTEKENKA